MFGKRKCLKQGHQTHPDPGDFVLYCMRCHLMADLSSEVDVRDYYLAGGASEEELTWTGGYDWSNDEML